MQQQTLLAGKGFIEPTVGIGVALFSASDSVVVACNGVAYLIHNNSYTIPANWKTKDYRYFMKWNSTAAYGYFCPRTYVYKNGVLIASWVENNGGGGYYRYNSGDLTHSVDTSLKAGDVLNAQMYAVGRNVGGTIPLSLLQHDLKRLT